MLTIFSSTVSYDFSSTQINFSPELSKRLRQWGYSNIPPEDVYQDDTGNKGRESDNHVTVKYGIITSDPDDIRDVIRGFGTFDIELGNVSRFARPDKDYDVVKIEVLGDKLHELHKLLGDKLENGDEFPEYRPHATFAYIKKGTCRELSGNDKFSGEIVKVHQIVFSPRTGNRTTIKLN